MNKLLTFLFAILFAIPCFATGVTATNGAANDATCDTNVLGSDSGSVELTPTWSANFDDLVRQQWKVPFGYGTIYDDAKCSNVPGTYAVVGDPGTTNGQYCWCKATGYKPTDSDVIYAPTSNLSWIYAETYGSSFCAYYCARLCAQRVQEYLVFRRAVFGQN